MSNQDKYETDTDNGDFWGIVLIAIGLSAVVVLCAVFSGCYSAKKAAQQYDRAYEKHREVVDAKTATFYKPRVFDSTRLVFTPGETVTRHDTTTQRDTVRGIITRTITNTSWKHDTLRQEHYERVDNRAAADSAIHVADMWRTKCQDDAVKSAKETSRLKSERSTWRWGAVIGWLLVIGSIVFKLIKAKAKLL